MGVDPDGPSVDEVVADLKVLRRQGLLRLRTLTLPAISQLVGLSCAKEGPSQVIDLLEDGLQRLGAGQAATVAGILFGIDPTRRGGQPGELRKTAAEECGVGVEAFRKGYEVDLISAFAQALIDCASERPQPPRPPKATKNVQPPRPPAPRPPVGRRPWSQITRDLERLEGLEPGRHCGRYGPYDIGGPGSLTVYCGAVEELRDVDIIVSSENTFLLPARPFAETLSGQLRAAAMERDANGALLRDVIAEELAAFTAGHHGGGPVPTGVVAATGAGSIPGVLRILHAAVAIPRESGYDVPGDGVARAIHECFRQANVLRAHNPRIDTISFPLFGAGDGGLTAERSFAQLWPPLRSDLVAAPRWHVVLTTWTVAETCVVLRGLAADPIVSRPDPPGPS